MTESINAKALDILKNSEQIFSPEQIRKAITDVAAKLNHDFDIPDVKTPPLVLSIMGGAAIFTGQLLPYLTFPLEFDFIHVSRYSNEEYGGEFIWKVIPRQNVINRTVIVLDDILDEGQTLLHVRDKLIDMGAAKVVIAVFADKQTGATKPIRADYVGLDVPNQFVIGFGMDIGGFWRNLPDIRVLTKEL
ncbi:hypoxanthine-guanine phosphoribosyltransferase [Oxalobacter formigenes]|uniref:hypoxanthine-guanine phosphoribosyltransferase n=1 Tax=Oxalobacter formigenes TaxID=847 RepID=UPI0022AFB45A|nr:hypoxanthine-guanine phosphoribosyltransferase [Oxalobacter formigenes]WAW06942.1 hypoxanthine-guanine phosphoribosyltransferase [Oxalobacter formigenes]